MFLVMVMFLVILAQKDMNYKTGYVDLIDLSTLLSREYSLFSLLILMQGDHRNYAVFPPPK